MLNDPTPNMKKLTQLIEEQTNWKARDDGSGNGIILHMFDGVDGHDSWVEATPEAVTSMINE